MLSLQTGSYFSFECIRQLGLFTAYSIVLKQNELIISYYFRHKRCLSKNDKMYLVNRKPFIWHNEGDYK